MCSVYDEPEGSADGMMAYKACHPCHNINKRCQRPLDGGQCKRCASTYIPRPWAHDEDSPSSLDGTAASGYVLARLQSSPRPELSLFENYGEYHTLTISIMNNSDSKIICSPPPIFFLGPLKYDNIELGPQFDQVVLCYLSTPKAEVSDDPQGLVSRACLAGGYLNLFFSVDNIIVDESESPPNRRTLLLGLSHFILRRLTSVVDNVMSLASVGPMSKNARLSLAALHATVNSVKIFTSKLQHPRLFYDDQKLSLLLKDWIHSLEGELRHIFQVDCGLIKDWGAPLDSFRKEFKNNARSFDPLTLRVKVSTWPGLVGGDAYPATLSTHGESDGKSPLSVDSLIGIELPISQFAGLERNEMLESEDWGSDHTSAGYSSPSTDSSIGYDDASMEGLPTYTENTALQPDASLGYSLGLRLSISGDQSAYHDYGILSDLPLEWELFPDSDQIADSEYQGQDLGSPVW